ncbi:hypothetical protein Mal4_23490 [Maioricimonas rarisocia]|uniref:Uncharacterized protein n=1 Tax=Maioricimonas rarisocia TaxID=2528026 RepID=A0A517Z6H1_9PLAN|nr:hypothetical protein [Maioricimonas rarisocia]QDU38029.1 hypothetical protein Mal4_23490 [Maioricimonas rarisocia]
MAEGNPWRRCAPTLCAVLFIAGIVGCGPTAPTGDVVETEPARGVLSFRGQPLKYHQVTLMPNGDRPAVAVSGEDGTVEFGTNEPGDGAVPGTHKVAVTYVGPPSDNPEEGVTVFSEPPPPEVEIDRKYANPETSGLTVTIPEGGDIDLKIELEPTNG